MTTTDRIASEIHETRHDFRSKIAEPQDRVKSAADWRRQYEKRPGTVIAAAVAVSALLAVVVSSKSRRSVADRSAAIIGSAVTASSLES